MSKRLSPREAAIWERYWERYGSKEVQVYFEVPILPLRPDGKTLTGGTGDWWEGVTALKADVMFRLNGDWCLVEVEEVLSTEGIGQVICYAALWNELNPGQKICHSYIISAEHDDRLTPTLAKYGITHIAAPDAGPA